MRRRSLTMALAVVLLLGVLIATQSAVSLDYTQQHPTTTTEANGGPAVDDDVRLHSPPRASSAPIVAQQSSPNPRESSATSVVVTTAASAATPQLGLMFLLLGRYTTKEEVAQVGEALTGWIEHVVVPQRNLHIAFFYDTKGTTWTTLTSLMSLIGLERFNETHVTLPSPNRYPILLIPQPPLDPDILAHGAAAGPSSSSPSSSSCCYCGVEAGAYLAAQEHWLSLEFFHHWSTQQYAFVVRVSPYTRFFRRPRFSLFGELQRVGALVGPVAPFSRHTAACGASNSFQLSPVVRMPPLPYAQTTTGEFTIAGFEDRFLLIKTEPFRRPTHHITKLQQYISQNKLKFVQDGWAASHVWAHVSATRTESTSAPRVAAAAWHWMLWQPKVLHKNAVLYFGATTKSIDDIKKWTRLRWSRVTREKTGF